MAKDTKADAMLTAIASFLESEGWKVLVIGSPRVQHQPADRDLNFEFVVRFTGKKITEDTQNGRDDGAAKTT